jgi:ribose transport system substrate-binding protein
MRADLEQRETRGACLGAGSEYVLNKEQRDTSPRSLTLRFRDDSVMKTLHYLTWVGVTLLLLGITGCSGGSGKPRVAFVSNNAESFWNIAEVGAKKRAAEDDVELYFQKPDGGETEQKEKIDQVMNQGIKAIAISVIDPEKQNAYLQSIAKKVALLTQDNDAPNSGRLCYIGTDNYAAGRAAGALVKQALPEGGTVAIFVGTLTALNARERRQGVVDELAGQKDASAEDGAVLGKYKLYKTYTDRPDSDKRAKANAVQAITDLQKEPNVCLVGLWAYNPPAILSAVKDQGKLGTIKIVGFDEEPATLNGIKDGHIQGTIVQQPYQFGYLSVKLMAQLAKGDKSGIPENGMMPVPHLAVTRDGKPVKDFTGKETEGKTAEVFHTELNKLLGRD